MEKRIDRKSSSKGRLTIVDVVIVIVSLTFALLFLFVWDPFETFGNEPNNRESYKCLYAFQIEETNEGDLERIQKGDVLMGPNDEYFGTISIINSNFITVETEFVYAEDVGYVLQGIYIEEGMVIPLTVLTSSDSSDSMRIEIEGKCTSTPHVNYHISSDDKNE